MASKKNKLKKKNKGSNNKNNKKQNSGTFFLSKRTKRYISGLIFILIAVILTLSFFGKAGIAGNFIFRMFSLLTGKAVFLLPFISVLSGFVFFNSNYKELFKPLLFAIVISLISISGILECLKRGEMDGGWLGYLFTFPFLKLFGVLVTQIVFFLLSFVGILIFWNLLKKPSTKQKIQPFKQETPVKTERKVQEINAKPSIIQKIFSPSFKVRRVEEGANIIVNSAEKDIKKEPSLDLKTKNVRVSVPEEDYKTPPLDLLSSVKEKPSAGDVNTNSAIIKKTLESFDIPVEMSGVNIGPTVTQYSLKPADGIKLSKITSLANDLALALATHPIRIEAPIPGKSLVGIEVPNNIRSFVTLRDLVANERFQNSPHNLTFCLGSDVSGGYIYDNLEKMPHLLVAGATGTGKTIFLNTLILSLVYRNSPECLKFLLIDPKRVEFTVYNNLPHLLCQPIVESQKAVNALQWLIGEMDRRFKLLAGKKSRNIASYNKKAFENGSEHLPYIAVIIDELADLMVAKGRDVETSIVRLAQMARAVGIHLVVATQRPSVEVITGLIKANITSRITFQVASQVDSRTVLDAAGAEKLLGLGDMLFISNEIVRPKRIQAAYVSEKEVKKIVEWIKSKYQESLDSVQEDEDWRTELQQALEKDSEGNIKGGDDELSFEKDPLYEEAKKVIMQYRRASASLLQRKLRIGYARAARIIDLLEEKGVIGPNRGAKAREIYISQADQRLSEEEISDENFEDYKDNDKWQSV